MATVDVVDVEVDVVDVVVVLLPVDVDDVVLHHAIEPTTPSV